MSAFVRYLTDRSCLAWNSRLSAGVMDKSAGDAEAPNVQVSQFVASHGGWDGAKATVANLNARTRAWWMMVAVFAANHGVVAQGV